MVTASLHGEIFIWNVKENGEIVLSKKLRETKKEEATFSYPIAIELEGDLLAVVTLPEKQLLLCNVKNSFLNVQQNSLKNNNFFSDFVSPSGIHCFKLLSCFDLVISENDGSVSLCEISKTENGLK